MNDAPKKTVLTIGSGHARPVRPHALFSGPDWEALHLDLTPDSRPDLISPLTDMGIVGAGEVDAVYSQHNLEHLYPHEVPRALAEFRRVLKDTGLAVISLPDVEAAARAIAEGGALRTLYDSPMGPVTPMDLLYGHHRSLATGDPVALHKCGFTREILHQALSRAGFAQVEVRAEAQSYSLWAVAHVTARPRREG